MIFSLKHRPWIPPQSGSIVTPISWPRLPSIPNNSLLLQLRDQRLKLNELLQDLQKPMLPENQPNINTPVLNSGNNNQAITNAQQTLMNIMQKVTPMISLLGQSGMVSKPRLEQSQLQLLDILKAVNGRELDVMEDSITRKKEIQQVEQLAEKLESVLDSIIADADKKTNSF